mmetsp:Transcript_125956/g.299005  ORF Transcript_125956/g.299005 Transcript_125956/m.299005 type:complete len:254 (+) Transcript_125956:1114-1875(+)
MAAHFSFTTVLSDPSASNAAVVSLMSCLACARSRSAAAFCSFFASSCFLPAVISSLLALTSPSWAFLSFSSCALASARSFSKPSLRVERVPATTLVVSGAFCRKADLAFEGFLINSSTFSRCVLVRSLMCLVTIVRSFDSALMRRACGICKNEDLSELRASSALFTDAADCVKSFSSSWNSASCCSRNATAVSSAFSLCTTSSSEVEISEARRELVAANSSVRASRPLMRASADSMLFALSSPLLLHQHCIFS